MKDGIMSEVLFQEVQKYAGKIRSEGYPYMVVAIDSETRQPYFVGIQDTSEVRSHHIGVYDLARDLYVQHYGGGS